MFFSKVISSSFQCSKVGHHCWPWDHHQDIRILFSLFVSITTRNRDLDSHPLEIAAPFFWPHVLPLHNFSDLPLSLWSSESLIRKTSCTSTMSLNSPTFLLYLKLDSAEVTIFPGLHSSQGCFPSRGCTATGPGRGLVSLSHHMAVLDHSHLSSWSPAPALYLMPSLYSIPITPSFCHPKTLPLRLLPLIPWRF